jgi:lipopolysaccharide assembly LptE-like protein
LAQAREIPKPKSLRSGREKGRVLARPGWEGEMNPFVVTRDDKGGRRVFQLPRVVGRTAEVAIVVLLISLVACGYEFGNSAKPGAAYGLVLAVPVFHNDTFEPILDRRVTDMVRRQFLQADGLTLVNDVSAAPLVLLGRVSGYGLQTMSFRPGQLEYRVVLMATVSMNDTGTKRLLWQELYTASAEFFLTADLAINRSRQDRATEEAAQMLAENIVSRVLEDYGNR